MEALSGATFERQVYDADGTLRETQTLTFGALQHDEADTAVVSVPVSIAKTGDSRSAQKTTDVIWRCDGNALAMLMSVGTYAGSGRRLDVSLQTTGPAILYPTAAAGGDTLADLVLTVRGRAGVFGLATARTRLSFVQRRVQPWADESGTYRVLSQVSARTSVFGLPVRRAGLRSEEWVDPEVGLIRHRLTSASGAVWQITRRDPLGAQQSDTSGDDATTAR